MTYNFSNEINIWNFAFYFLTFDMEAPFRSLSLNIINEFGSYIEQAESPGYSLKFYDLFREQIVHWDLQ